MAPPRHDRYEPLPPLTRLPGWLVAKLSARGKFTLGAASLVAAVALGLAVAELVRTGERQAGETRATDRRKAVAAERALAEDQRPRRARLPAAGVGPASPLAVATLERGITLDARGRARAGLIEGPIKSTACTQLNSGATATTALYSCFSASSRAELNYDIDLGYRFNAKVDSARGTVVWCKRNPRPLHPDTASFKTLPLDPACRP